MTFNFSWFSHQGATIPRSRVLTWPEIKQEFTSGHTVFSVPRIVSLLEGGDEWETVIKEARAGMPLFSPNKYKRGANRSNAGVETMSCFVADLDCVEASEMAALQARWSGLNWVMYSTSKSTSGAPRLRVIFPLSEPVPATEWLRVWLKLTYHLTDNRNDSATKDLARIHFTPIVPEGLEECAFCDVSDGQFLDPSHYEDPPAFEQVTNLINRGSVIGAGSPKGEGKPGHDFNERATVEDILEILQRHGWQEHSRRGFAVYVTRPGKDTRAGLSGVIGWPGDTKPVFYCFTSSATPLEARAYAPFGLMAILDHGGNFSESTRELGSRGYGSQIEKSVRVRLRSQDLGERQDKSEATNTPIALADFNKTDAGNAERLVSRHGNDIRWVPGLGWRVWDGRRWAPDETTVTRYARDTVRALYKEAADLLMVAHREPDIDQRKKLSDGAAEIQKFALKSEATRSLGAMVEQSKSFSQIFADTDQFNLKPWQVPFQNGVWDRGRWRGHQREDYIEHLLPVYYDPQADRSEWLSLLDRMTGGDLFFAGTLQEIAGYCLSGASTLRLLPWAYGPKGTGKSTFAELLQTLLGGAAKALDTSLISGDRETERLGVAVRSMRAVFLPEVGRKRLDAELLKTLTGSDRIPCRMLYSNVTFSVMPSWAVFAVANDPPAMNAHDEALRDRVVALPFVHKLDEGGPLEFSGGRRLEEVRRRSDSDLVAGFAAWAVEGLERVYEAQAIYKAPIVLEHTRLFWGETDPVTPFWETVDKQNITDGISTSFLHKLYLNWCEAEGIKRPLQGRYWASACRASGLEEYKKSTRIDGKVVSERGWRLPKNVGHVGQINPVFSESLAGREGIEEFSENRPLSVLHVLHDDRMIGEF